MVTHFHTTYAIPILVQSQGSFGNVSSDGYFPWPFGCIQTMSNVATLTENPTGEELPPLSCQKRPPRF